MTDELSAQAAELKDMVENHWRSLIRLAAVNPQMAGEEVFRFEALIDQMATNYTPVQAAWFRSTIMGLRGKYAEWERTDPNLLWLNELIGFRSNPVDRLFRSKILGFLNHVASS